MFMNYFAITHEYDGGPFRHNFHVIISPALLDVFSGITLMFPWLFWAHVSLDTISLDANCGTFH